MKRPIIGMLALCSSVIAMGETVDVKTLEYTGPYPVQMPLMFDSVDVNSRKFDVKSLLDTHVSQATLRNPEIFSGDVAPGSDDGYALHLLGFTVENRRYAKASLNVKGLKNYNVYVDGRKLEGNQLVLTPATHKIAVKYLSEKGKSDSVKVSLDLEHPELLKVGTGTSRMYTLDDVLHGTRISSTSISPDGKYMITSYYHTRKGGAYEYVYRISDVAAGNVVAETSDAIKWMPKGSRYYYTRNTNDGRVLYAVDVATGRRDLIASDIPNEWFTISPDESYLIITSVQSGPKESPDVYEIIQPEDRQPGWRDRYMLAKYDLATGVQQPITFGHKSVSLSDISDDSKKLLVRTSRSRLTSRPTTLTSLYVIDLATMTSTPVVEDDGFISGAMFSPDATKVLVSGSPESLDGVGRNLPEGRTPSMVDEQLYLINIADRKVTPLTKEFDPNIQQHVWSRADNMIYFTAENRDMYSLYRLNPANGDITMIPVPEDLVKGISLPDAGRTMAWFGQGASNSDRLYKLDTKTLKSTLLDDPVKEQLKDVVLGECRPWSFKSSRGDSIHGRFYLPPNFDPASSYPMIVNYYGGCSPTSRNFESRYPHHAYAALGYVVFVIEPSGATGFGQEFASRHVNTAGDGVAQDIIEGTKQFCAEHPFVNAQKIGCIGASYGGFMTQYLQTQTDIFAAAISHAGISDHTSYWGEGYWGYSYSEVSMANSYPWTHPDLYVKQSPLYNADKIHTPLLFLHGDKDNNVPVGESIQMFTALKLLGRETAFVAVADQDHHITDYGKRIKWQNTIYAWFAKWLQDDPEWWNAMYPAKSL